MRPFQDNAGRHPLPLPGGALAFAASLIWLVNVLSSLGAAFCCFGFRISRLLRICPLAMTERPFESCLVVGPGNIGRFETILRRHPFVTFLVIADAILR